MQLGTARAGPGLLGGGGGGGLRERESEGGGERSMISYIICLILAGVGSTGMVPIIFIFGPFYLDTWMS